MVVLSEIPSVQDRESLARLLSGEADDVEHAKRVAAAFWQHVDTVSLWSTSCDIALVKDPVAYYQRKALLSSAMHDDMHAFLSCTIPAAVCTTDDDARLLGRLAEVARWISRYCETIHAALDGHELLTSRTPDMPPLTFTSRNMARQDVRERYEELAAQSWMQLLRPENYGFDTTKGRNSMRLDQLGAALTSRSQVEAEVARLQGIRDVFFSPSPSGNAAENTLLFFDPPLAHFELLRDVHDWACSLATQDLHTLMLRTQDAVLADLKNRLARIRAALPAMRQMQSDQRREIFSGIDQLHYDAQEFQRAIDADQNHPALRPPMARGGGPMSSVICCGTVPSDAPQHTAPHRTVWSVLTCSAENSRENAAEMWAQRGAPGTQAAARAKAIHNRVIVKHVINETAALRQQMDTAYPTEYSSGLSARASRAVDAMLRWAQGVTVVLGPTTTARS